MTYDKIIELALSYADRQDAEVIDNMDNFLRIVEARVNRKLEVMKMSNRAKITAQDGQYYGLPEGFNGLRDIQVYNAESPNNISTLQYMSPEQLNSYSGVDAPDGNYYTIIANQIQIAPAVPGMVLEIVYYRDLPELNSVQNTNWLSLSAPDGYVFGLCVEINSFVKDGEAATMWDGRFTTVLNELMADDDSSRWSGTAMQTRVG